jgi:2-polyprenyl-3-methyl-5-hydroxy-6-metoxy-1,4-benzoquinol methylase
VQLREEFRWMRDDRFPADKGNQRDLTSGRRSYYDNVHYSSAAVEARIDRKLAVSDPWYQLILKLLDEQGLELQGKHTLEVGCGLGGFCSQLMEWGADVWGVDFSATALRAASRLLLHDRSTKIHKAPTFLVADAKRLPFRNEAFDIVICAETLEHTFDVETCLSELHRTCSNLGYVALTIPNSVFRFPFDLIVKLLGKAQPEQSLTYFRLRSMIKRAGFQIVKERGTNFFPEFLAPDLLPEQWVRIPDWISSHVTQLMHSSTVLWTVGAGTVGFLCQKQQIEARYPTETASDEASLLS